MYVEVVLWCEAQNPVVTTNVRQVWVIHTCFSSLVISRSNVGMWRCGEINEKQDIPRCCLLTSLSQYVLIPFAVHMKFACFIRKPVISSQIWMLSFFYACMHSLIFQNLRLTTTRFITKGTDLPTRTSGNNVSRMFN